MGFIFSKILDFFSRSRNKFKIIILGIQNAGKTTILYRLSIGQLVKTTPTIGSNVEEISYNNVKLQAWDLGGQESSRSVWDIYFTNTDAIIYVIDTNDETYDDSKEQFYKLLKNETLRNAVILIYANKQDLPGAKNVGDIIKIYGLDNIKDHIWHIQPCSAQTGEGLITGMKWLSDQLVFKSDNNFPINPYVDNTEKNNEENNKENEINDNNINNIIKEENINENNNIENKIEENKEEKIDNDNDNYNNINIENKNNQAQ
jgi:small GTP-binding protein